MSSKLSKLEAASAKCSYCQGYLSASPVMILSDEPVCARCVSHVIGGTRAYFYEVVAQNTIFPCKNDVYGCEATLPWESSIEHEKCCNFNPIECPASSCVESLTKHSFKKHVCEKHPDLIIKNFQIEITKTKENSTVAKFFLWRNDIFILQIRTCNLNFQCNIFSIAEIDYGIKYDLIFPNSNKGIIGNVTANIIYKYGDNMPRENILDFKTYTRNVEKNKITCIVDINDSRPQENYKLNEHILGSLECPICLTHMRPPIYMCDIGHSFCSECKKCIKQCPTCRIFLKQARNFALEHIAECISYPCVNKHEGCTFCGELKSLLIHERNCPLSQSTDSTWSCQIS